MTMDEANNTEDADAQSDMHADDNGGDAAEDADADCSWTACLLLLGPWSNSILSFRADHRF